jgi:cell division protein FtsB
MFKFKLKKMLLTLFFCVLSALLVPPIAQAELGGSGSTAARDATAQKAAKERKLEKKRLKEAEAKKAAETQQGQPAETQAPATEPKQEPAAK